LGEDVPIHFTAFHPDFKLMHRPPTPQATLQMARKIALEAGIKYVYVGNVDNVKEQSTYCHECGELLIERNWYELGRDRIRDGKCLKCKSAVAGVFEDAQGSWGRRRLPVTFRSE
jgi:pyruvate formate lyase activating enzyme